MLANEPLFHLSLHSKELFHSNLLGWFINEYPDAAREVLVRLGVPTRPSATIHRVRRESKNLDLVVEVPGLAPVIIENKVFSLPDEEQLDRYSAGKLAGLDDPHLILLSLASPGWITGTYVTSHGTWHAVDYTRMSSALHGVVDLIAGESGSEDRFGADVVSHYAAMLESLIGAIDAVTHPASGEPFALDLDSQAALQSVRIYDAAAKLRSRQVIYELRDAVKDDRRFIWHSGFTNGHPLIEAFLTLACGDRLGWQYQGHQWRLAIVTAVHVGVSEEIRRVRHAYVKDRYRAWFDFEAVERLTGARSVPKAEQRDDFNRYNPSFVYRYRSVPEVTIGQLTELARHAVARSHAWT